jgi:hypothetical protein
MSLKANEEKEFLIFDLEKIMLKIVKLKKNLIMI